MKKTAHKSSKEKRSHLLKSLNTIQRLEVGPVKVEKRRLIAPYTVRQNGKSEKIELIYRYEDEVFDPNDRGSVNLASMIAAQVAINYGLFCNEIVFHGTYDAADRKFIEDAAKNTAREIYVKKFLEANPFLIGEAAELPVVKKENYLQAKLIFQESPNELSTNKDLRQWSVDRSRIAVLSSGGKDSLLSYGLLNEMGYETFSYFVNESGRHWFTALNGYRYFKTHHAQTTGRVWTNCDRVFAWMLRHLPFVREDFATLRADEYPIRLWTVAVFLFGVLPLLKKRGIGRLVIGDEYDTSDRRTHQGITHYNGLYDQSRYFDNALSRYYKQKGWGVSQFSLLRQLSELLIMKVLTQRYPRLQRHQISCHAAHIDGERVLPCGKCEKCRRIVAMMIALGADPKNCGYSKEQIDDGLNKVAEEGVHQESAGAEHLAFLLNEKDLLPKHTLKIRQRPEVMKIRVDAARSPIAGIPIDLRGPLFKIFLEYAESAAQREDKTWKDFDILKAPELKQPYPFEDASATSRISKSARSSIEDKYLLGELTWPEAKIRFKEVDVALLPIGAIEQHGPHLPLDTDSYDADYLAKEIAKRCSNPKPLALPLIPYGVSYHHDDFSGTISVSNETLSRFVYEIGMSAARNGIKKLVIINGHGGNAATLKFAAQMINRDAHIFTCVDTGETSDTDIDAMAETTNDVHAGEIETSTTLALRPDLVKMSKAKKFVPRFSSRYLDFSSKRSVEWNARTLKISSSGVLGDPTKASREKGEKMWEIMITNLVEFVESIKGMTLGEIYEKRY